MPGIEYPSLSFEIAEQLVDELPDLLASSTILGSVIEDAGAGRSRVTVFFPADGFGGLDEVARIMAARGAVDVSPGVLSEQDWIAAYRDTVTAFAVGSLWWMDPHPASPTPAPEGRARLAIEPRSAFGTGSHESTQLILLELEAMAIEGAAVLDVGSGTGILALAAERRGAGWVVGVDTDPEAIWVGRQVADQQEWAAEPRYLVGSVSCLAGARFDVILCNMIRDHFVPMLADIHRLLADHGEAVFSGILDVQSESVQSELAAVGLDVVRRRQMGEWLCLCAVRA